MQFRTKARAVELLGKGQISDLPTAISELWKNGYDAYGDCLEAFLYLPGYSPSLAKPIFVMSDDGKGMTKDDILNKWVVLGTDSKSRNEGDVLGIETLFKDPRVKMGEKGIGRLSVAYLGSQMLMVTKKMGSPTQAVFFDWQILENYNLFLEQINIPIKEVLSKDSFRNTFEDLKNEFRGNFETYKIENEDPWVEQLESKRQILDRLDNLILPDFFEEEILLNLVGDKDFNHGTRFIIFNPDPQLLLLKKADKPKQDDEDNETVTHIRTSLLGLFNVFKGEEREYQTHFWICNGEGKYDFIEKREFFSIQDFDVSDHEIKGDFDLKGNFNGKIRIFDKWIDHSFKPPRPIDKSSYGPFELKLGMVQGEKGFETPILNGGERLNFLTKLNEFGAVYIYRDGFRVLPYGRTDYDFLEFEKRRTLSAGDYFFSHRRMFGYISITRQNNTKLIDKAGREGFINNIAYRDFVNDLKSFFIDLGKKYFGTNAKDETRREIQGRYQDLIINEKLEKEREKTDRREYAALLARIPKELSAVKNELALLSVELAKKVQDQSSNGMEISSLLKKIEDNRLKLVSLKLMKPTRFRQTDVQRKKSYDYDQEYEDSVSYFATEVDEIVSSALNKLHDQELLNEFNNRANQYKLSLENDFFEFTNNVNQSISRLKENINLEKEHTLSEYSSKLKQVSPVNLSRISITNSLQLIEKIHSDLRQRANVRIQPFLNHLTKINLDVNEDDLMGFYKIKYEEITEELEQTRELAQLGIAVEIIDHEFNVLYSQLANTIKGFDGLVAASKFKLLSDAFEHLDNNYKLLQPLYKTSGRIRKKIYGKELFTYSNTFFANQILENNISYSITNSGCEFLAESFESIFKAVIINIINNAIFWVRFSEDRKIVIDGEDNKLLIFNSGQPIEGYLLEDIFKLFYTKRPQGRGIGLYLAKQSLSQLGYDIYATNDPNYNKLNGACFIIELKKNYSK
jgi:signal transduction histidine kinase